MANGTKFGFKKPARLTAQQIAEKKRKQQATATGGMSERRRMIKSRFSSRGANYTFRGKTQQERKRIMAKMTPEQKQKIAQARSRAVKPTQGKYTTSGKVIQKGSAGKAGSSNTPRKKKPLTGVSQIARILAKQLRNR